MLRPNHLQLIVDDEQLIWFDEALAEAAGRDQVAPGGQFDRDVAIAGNGVAFVPQQAANAAPVLLETAPAARLIRSWAAAARHWAAAVRSVVEPSILLSQTQIAVPILTRRRKGRQNRRDKKEAGLQCYYAWNPALSALCAAVARSRR